MGKRFKGAPSLRCTSSEHPVEDLLDWLEALCNFTPIPIQPALLAEGKPLPYPELLFKLRADWQRYRTIQ